MNASILSVLLCLVVAVNCNLPDYIHVCHRDDPQLSVCIVNSVNALLPRLKVGIPELEIPPMEPMHFKNVTLNTGTGGARMATNLTDITVWNASNYTITDLTVKLSQNYFRFKVRIPYLHAEGNYETDTRILILELKGNGRFYLNVTDFNYECTLKGEVIFKDNEQHLVFEKIKIKIGYGIGSIFIDNLFNGHPLLGKAVNKVLNDHADIFFHVMKPNFEETISNTFTDIANKITLKFNYKELFPRHG